MPLRWIGTPEAPVPVGSGRSYKPEAPAKPIVPPSAAPSRPVNFGSGDLVLIAVFLHSGVW